MESIVVRRSKDWRLSWVGGKVQQTCISSEPGQLWRRHRLAASSILLLVTTLFAWSFAPQREGCTISPNLVFESYFGASLVSELHTCSAAGRLGNRVFQNLAVSLIAQRWDLATRYSLESESSRLGLKLFSGRRLMVGRSTALVEDSLRPLLEGEIGAGKESSAREGDDAATAMAAGARFSFSPHGVWFQTPWFARKLRGEVLPAMRESMLRANPWRNRLSQNNDTFVHVRIGDKEETVRSVNDYASAIAAARGGNTSGDDEPLSGSVYIASDSPHHAVVRELVQRFRATLLEDLDRVEIIQFGATAQKLVLSDGTFSWLIGVVSDVLAGRTSETSPELSPPPIRVLARPEKWLGDIFVFREWLRL